MKFVFLWLATVVYLAGCASTGAGIAPAQVLDASTAPKKVTGTVLAPHIQNPAQNPAPNALPADHPPVPTPATTSQPAAGAPAPAANTADGPLSAISATEAASQGVMQLASPADLWDRIRRSYAMPNLESDLVQDREQWYATRPDYILRMTERSRKYLFHIVEELERRNMPTELALLPFIESAFNPQAVSSAKAAGMWQFMPATGKHFELTQNAFRDDRRDVLASTRAALDYLQKLYGMFGDWHLALAAYNWGEGSVGRAIAKNKKAGLGTTYLDLKMPAETRLYVPKLQAVKNILTNPDAFNANLPLIENHPFFQPVTITRDIDVALAAQLAEVTVDEFKALNPSANRPVILAAGNAQILLPWDNATTFEANLAARNGGQLASWTVWVAPSTLKPADAAKRAGMAEADFRAVNHIPPKVLIKAGSTLLVPRGGRVENDVSVALADHGQVSLSSEITTRRSMVKAGKHDSVASLAKRYRIAASDVASWNKVAESAAFKPGQKVVLYLPSSGKSTGKAGGKSRGAGRSKTAAGASAKAPSKGGTSTRGQGKSAKIKKR